MIFQDYWQILVRFVYLENRKPKAESRKPKAVTNKPIRSLESKPWGNT